MEALNDNNNVQNNNNANAENNNGWAVHRLAAWCLDHPGRAALYGLAIWLTKKGICQLVLRAWGRGVGHKADTIKAVAQNALNQGTGGGAVGGALKPGFGLRNGAWGWHK